MLAAGNNPIDQLVKTTITGMHTVEKFNFAKFMLRCALYFHEFEIDWNLLRAMAKRWNPYLHIFHIGHMHLCPTHEDYCGIMGISTSGPLVRPSLKTGYSGELATGLNISKEEAKALVRNGRLDLVPLLSPYHSRSHPINVKPEAWRATRDYRLCLGILAQYILTSKSEGQTVPESFIDIASQLSRKANPVPLILAETFSGLDAIKKGEGRDFKGSPHLLYMWLCDRLKIVDIPSTLEYRPEHFSRRNMLVRHNSVKAWGKWLDSRLARHIGLRCPWWMTDYPVLGTKGSYYVRLIGLEETSFYQPALIPEQYGVPIEFSLPQHKQFFSPEPLTEKLVHLIEKAWNKRTLGYPDGPAEFKESVVRTKRSKPNCPSNPDDDQNKSKRPCKRM